MNKKVAVVVILAPFMLAAERGPSKRVVSGTGMVTIRVNGEPVVLRIDPAAPAMPLIDGQLVENGRLKIKGGRGIGVGYSVGGTPVPSRTQVVQIDFGTGATKRRIGLTGRPFAAAADGSVGPEAFSEKVVRFQLREPIAGETTISLPMARDTAVLGMFGSFSPTFGGIDVGGEPMRVRFDPYHARSLVTAGAGARLARLNDGVIIGDAAPTEIFFGVKRPVRTLVLRRSLQLGPLAIGTLGIRTADYGSVSGIREGGANGEQVDPDEVVVIAKGRKRDVRRDTISLGADYLSRCSSIVFDRGAKSIRLTCG